MPADVTPLRPAPDAPTVGLHEAARITGKSVATVRRRRAELTKLGATSTKDGWTIPIPALVAVGLLDRVTGPEVAVTPPPDAKHGTPPKRDALPLTPPKSPA